MKSFIKKAHIHADHVFFFKNNLCLGNSVHQAFIYIYTGGPGVSRNKGEDGFAPSSLISFWASSSISEALTPTFTALRSPFLTLPSFLPPSFMISMSEALLTKILSIL